MFKTHQINIRNPAGDLERHSRETRGDREMTLAMMQSGIRELKKNRTEASAARDRILEGAGFDSYDEFVRAAIPRQPERGVVAWLRSALRTLSALGGAVARPPSRESVRHPAISPPLMDAIQMRQLEIDAVERRLNSLEVEVQKKFSIPAACIVFVLVGAPIGMRARKSGIANAFVSILFFVFYYLCLAGGEELADRRLLAPWLAMWIPNIVIGAIGLVLTLRTTEVIPKPQRRRRGGRRALPA
jgi:lipopolysaccharide export system permease protein